MSRAWWAAMTVSALLFIAAIALAVMDAPDWLVIVVALALAITGSLARLFRSQS